MEGRATKRYATLAALTLALGGAVFLNWSFAGRTPQAGTPEAVVQTSAEADEDTVQTAARQPETNAAVEPMTAQAVFDPLESEPQTAAQADAAEEMESGGQAGKNYGEAQLVSVSKDSGTEFFEQSAGRGTGRYQKDTEKCGFERKRKRQHYPKAAKPDQQHHGGIQH